jgi:hypothetical protein
MFLQEVELSSSYSVTAHKTVLYTSTTTTTQIQQWMDFSNQNVDFYYIFDKAIPVTGRGGL